VDPVGLKYRWHYAGYEKREPGYSQCWLEAYNYAFQAPNDGKITSELILGIHKKAMAFKKDEPAGCYRSISTNFKISFNEYHHPDPTNPGYTASREGLSEFFDYWFTKSPVIKHSIVFVEKLETFSTFYMVTRQNKDRYKWNVKEKGKRPQEEWLDQDSHNKRVTALVINNKQFDCIIDAMPDIYIAEIMRDEIERQIQIIIEEFDADMHEAKSNDDKITAIARHIQHIAQLHPLLDGNIRTCYILVNKLLRDHGLPLSILLNPNRFDCCSISQVVDMIKQGQVHFQRLMKNEGDVFQFDSENELAPFRKFNAGPENLIGVDVKTVGDFVSFLIPPPRVTRH